MKTLRDNALMNVGTLLLLAANWLAFHDFREPHTVRDWLMLCGSVLVLTGFAGVVWKQKLRAS